VPTDDPLLIHWVKEPAPFIGLPPPNMNLTGWRDPFVVERPCETNDGEWIVLMGSGAHRGGSAWGVDRLGWGSSAHRGAQDGDCIAQNGDWIVLMGSGVHSGVADACMALVLCQVDG
jgi:hypothetical protein